MALKLRVLVGCECSGMVRDSFRSRGHDAWSCDLKPSESPGHHYQCDVRSLLRNDRGPLGIGWDLLIAHPDCTFLTCSAEWAYGDGPYHMNLKPGTLTGAARREARRRAVAFVKMLAGCGIPHIAIENPRGHLSSAFRKPDQTIQPYQFGDDASKETCLWLQNLPPLKPTRYIEPRMVCCGVAVPDAAGKYGCPNCCGEKAARPRWGNQTDGGQNKLTPSAARAADRARTYQGIADAMADQWGAAAHAEIGGLHVA